VLGAGGGVAAALAPALLLAARNALCGLSLVPVLRGRFARPAAQSQLIIDESTAMARAPALCVAALLVWRRAPFLVVVLGAAATAALVRAVA